MRGIILILFIPLCFKAQNHIFGCGIGVNGNIKQNDFYSTSLEYKFNYKSLNLGAVIATDRLFSYYNRKEYTDFGLVYSFICNIGVTTRIEKKLVFGFSNGFGFLGASKNNKEADLDKGVSEIIQDQFIYINPQLDLHYHLNKTMLLGINTGFLNGHYTTHHRGSISGETLLIGRVMLSFRYILFKPQKLEKN